MVLRFGIAIHSFPEKTHLVRVLPGELLFKLQTNSQPFIALGLRAKSLESFFVARRFAGAIPGQCCWEVATALVLRR